MTVFFGLLLAKAEFEIARIIANRAGWKSGSVIEKSRPNIERFKNTAICGEGGRAQASLFEYHLAGQMAGNYFSKLAALLSRFNHGFTRTIVFGGNGCSFSIELVDRRPIWIE